MRNVDRRNPDREKKRTENKPDFTKKYKKIVILDSVILYPEHRYRLEQIAEEIVEYNTCYTEEEVLERVKGADCIISCWVDISNRVIEENPQIKTIAFWTHAYEHRIDKKFAEEHNIFVPCIPDYGTDSVAELLFIGLLHLMEKEREKYPLRSVAEQVAQHVSDNVRKFNYNMKANLRGSWTHEYVKNGELKITSPDEFKEETLKGMTIGFIVDKESFSKEYIKIFSDGLKMNVIHSICDVEYDIGVSFRPIERFLTEANIIVYDSTIVDGETEKKIKKGSYTYVVDINDLEVKGSSFAGKKLGIIGLGRIGTRAAQIAVEGFGMDVIYYSRTRKPEVEERYGIKYVSLNEVLENSDIISFHLPHVGAENFITNDMIDRIPEKTVVVNVSVGNIFDDQEYLFNRFEEGDLIGYVDVYSTLPPRIELKNRKDHLISTYRLGWRTKSTIGLKTHKLITKLKYGLEEK